MRTATLDTILDEVMLLDPEQRDMLVEIVRKRQIELHREELLRDIQGGMSAYERGELQPQTAKEIIEELRKSLEQ